MKEKETRGYAWGFSPVIRTMRERQQAHVNNMLSNVATIIKGHTYSALKITVKRAIAQTCIYMCEQVIANNPNTGNLPPQNTSTRHIWQLRITLLEEEICRLGILERQLRETENDD